MRIERGEYTIFTMACSCSLMPAMLGPAPPAPPRPPIGAVMPGTFMVCGMRCLLMELDGDEGGYGSRESCATRSWVLWEVGR